MTHDELLERLNGFEWNDVEFKECQREVSRSAYDTVSAFANTSGGWLIFGVRQVGGGFEVVGVSEVDKVQNDFLSALRSGQMLSRPIAVTAEILNAGDKAVLAFYIPEARRQDKPIFRHGDIRQSFVRRGGGDERCTSDEIARFLRDASEETYDSDVIELDPETFFDPDSVQWYRRVLVEHDPSLDPGLSDLEFLHSQGFVVEKPGKLVPTRAGVMLFGTAAALNQILPRPVVDCQWINAEWPEVPSDQRWVDRLVAETNLVRAWRQLVDRYFQHAERPFAINPETLRREDLPPDYVSFREAAINLLIHQDYGDHTRKPEIRFFQDRTVFWNPGDAFALTEEQLLEPGPKPVRNPRIVTAFRRIGLSEQAGTGVRAIFASWRRLGRIPPVVKNDKGTKSFELTLLKVPLITEEQQHFQDSLGVSLSAPEAAAFALACRQDIIRLVDVRAVTGLSGPAARDVLERLEVERLVERVPDARDRFVVANHLRSRMPREAEHFPREGSARRGAAQGDEKRERLVSDQPGAEGRLVTDQPPKAAGSVSDQPRPQPILSKTQWKIVGFCTVPRQLGDIMAHVGVTHRTFFRSTHLNPLLKQGILRMTHPEQVHHPDQAYVLTEAGQKLQVETQRPEQTTTGEEGK